MKKPDKVWMVFKEGKYPGEFGFAKEGETTKQNGNRGKALFS